MNKKIFTTLLLFLSSLMMAFSFSSCFSGHFKHSWTFRYDEEHHWKACTECSRKKSKRAHIYDKNDACTVCDFIVPTEGLTYKKIDGKEEYAVSGIGTATETDIVIASIYNDLPVTEIASEAFEERENLTSVRIPNSVTKIGPAAFYGCTALATIDLPDKLNEITAGAFNGTAYYNNENNWENGILYVEDCLIDAKTNSVDMSDDVIVREGTRLIASHAFSNSLIYNITLPSSLLYIGSSAFAYCNSLHSMNIPNGVESIGDRAFIGCTWLESVVISDSVTNLGMEAFEGCKRLESVTLSKNIKTINRKTFWACESLKEITLPDQLTSIGSSNFVGCDALTEIVIPKSVITMGDWAFAECENLTIYCEAKERPSTWHEDWNHADCPVVWDYQK